MSASPAARLPHLRRGCLTCGEVASPTTTPRLRRRLAYGEEGMYVLEIFLAVRLVVDPAMNLLGWSLEEGRDFMRDHSLESETQIESESLRYAADMPAQALAYQMGKLKFIELRERAANRLGARFDLRRFHEAVLEHGSLPMAVLERHIDRWLVEEAAALAGS